MSLPAAGRTFRYEALDRSGRKVADVVRADDERAAVRRLQAEGLTVTQVSAAAAGGGRSLQDRDLRPAERVMLLRQLAVMLEAGVPLLEALASAGEGLDAARARTQLAAVNAALRRGEAFGRALAVEAPGFPVYVYALADLGEASGRIPEVLRQAADQMAYEDRLRRDLINALTYPAFLAVAGLAAVGFILVEVVPRFSAMIGPAREKAPWLSRLVLSAGDLASGNLWAVLAVVGGLVALGAMAFANAGVRGWLYRTALAAPVVGPVLFARDVAAWARLTGFALSAGLDILSAGALSRRAVADPAMKRGLERVEGELRAGAPLDAALAAHTRLTAMDLSLVRAGQRSGALAKMFGFLADAYEGRLRDAVKRMTAIIEPAAVGVISLIVGAVALALVMALSTVYEAIY